MLLRLRASLAAPTARPLAPAARSFSALARAADPIALTAARDPLGTLGRTSAPPHWAPPLLGATRSMATQKMTYLK